MSNVPVLIRVSGPWGFVLLYLAAVVLFLSIRAVWSRVRDEAITREELEAQANGVLFWGGAAAVMGFLGQCQGTYIALNAIMAATEISPQVVAEGFVISFVPTLFGIGIFSFALVVWTSLRFLPRRKNLVAPLILGFLALGPVACGPREIPEGIDQGVWALEADPSVFLWQFASAPGGSLTCMVHEILEGSKFLETPCASASVQGDELEVEMPNGVRFQGRVEVSRATIDGRLLYVDGSSREAPLRWASLDSYPTLQPKAGGAEAYSYSVPEAMDDGWEVGSAWDFGIDPEGLDRAIRAIIRGDAGFLKSIVVARGGALVLEEYFHGYGPDRYFPIHSCTKSISSLLVGLAIQEDRIPSVDVPLLDFFPEEADKAGSGWEGLTLEHLLTMSLALDWSPEEADGLHGAGPDAFRQILERNVSGRPGEDWEYVNMNVNLLAGVLKKATGEHAEVFAERTLFEPLGIRDWNWDFGKREGFNLMDGSLRLRTRDMAKIGVMALNGGVWNDHRVIGEDWIRQSLTPHLSTGSGTESYGYLWWMMNLPGPDGRPLDVLFANGWGSQFILLFPELDLVVVTTGGNQENGKHLAIGEVLIRDLLPAVGRESS